MVLANPLFGELLQRAVEAADLSGNTAAEQDPAHNLRLSLRLMQQLQSPKIDISEFLDRLCQLYTSLHGVKFSMMVDEPVLRMLPTEMVLPVLTISSEAMTNAAKHAAVSRVDVLVELEPRQLTVMVLDQGCGFDLDEALKRHLDGGLARIRRLAQDGGAVVKVLSKPGSGSKVQIRLSLPTEGEAINTNVDDKKRKHSIFLVDDSNIFLAGLRSLLEANKWQVSGGCNDALTAISQARDLSPTIVILNISLAGDDTFSLMRWLKTSLPSVLLLVLTDNQEREKMDLAIACGANAYLRRNSPVSDLLNALNSLEHGAFQLSPEFAQKFALESYNHTANIDDLTPIQKHILDLVQQRLTNREIADRLSMSIDGVKYHIKKIRIKKAMNKKSELVSRK